LSTIPDAGVDTPLTDNAVETEIIFSAFFRIVLLPSQLLEDHNLDWSLWGFLYPHGYLAQEMETHTKTVTNQRNQWCNRGQLTHGFVPVQITNIYIFTMKGTVAWDGF
jgi:hypothetical protein